MTNIAGRFAFEQPLVIRDFSCVGMPYKGLAVRLLSDAPIQAQYDAFVKRVGGAVGREYLPIYRMADGEFAFLVGRLKPAGSRSCFDAVRDLLSSAYHRFIARKFSTIWGEQYDKAERTRAVEHLASCIRTIADRGILAVYFVRRGDEWSHEYFEPVCQWFDDNSIKLFSSNYIPFYLVYALLNGPDRQLLYKGRRVLVVSHLSADRRAALTRALVEEGASAVEFIGVSATRALFDAIDVTPFIDRVDLAIVAAGIGAANILLQLAPLSVPCIDAGISVDCLIDPSHRGERPFLIADDRYGKQPSSQT